MKICKYCKQPIQWTICGWKHQDYFACMTAVHGSMATPTTIKEYYDAL